MPNIIPNDGHLLFVYKMSWVLYRIEINLISEIPPRMAASADSKESTHISSRGAIQMPLQNNLLQFCFSSRSFVSLMNDIKSRTTRTPTTLTYTKRICSNEFQANVSCDCVSVRMCVCVHVIYGEQLSDEIKQRKTELSPANWIDVSTYALVCVFRVSDVCARDNDEYIWHWIVKSNWLLLI